MKKLICLLLLVCVTATATAESIDLSSMSYDELVALKDRINLAMWNSQKWQEVIVPQGIWKVGEDIPAGSWTVRCAAAFTAVIEFGPDLTENGDDIEYKTRRGRCTLDSPEYRHYKKNISIEQYSFTVEEGDYILIVNCDLIFTPYSGKPDLGFK